MAEITPSKKSAHAEPALLASGALAWLGVQVCFLLWQQHAGVRSLLCPAQAGCEAVAASKYSAFLGVPLPWLGAGFYLTLLSLTLAAYGTRDATSRKRLLGLLFLLTIVGVSFSAALMYVQFGVLRAFCPLCTTSALLMLGLALTTWRAERLGTAPANGSRSTAMALAIFALISSAFLIASSISPPAEVVAVVDDEQFTRDQMEQELGPQRQSLNQEIYKLETDWVTSKVDAALLSAEARRQGRSVEEMIAAKVRLLVDFTDQEISAELARRAPSTRHLESAAARRELAISRLVGEVAAGHRIAINLKKPPLKFLRSDLSTAKLAGPRDAPVQLVVFSDFQCEVCSRLAPVLEKVRKEFPREVLLAYRYFPLESHPRAFAAAIAAECAAQQGAFWQYHDKLFAEGGDLSDAKLRSLAATGGLDEKRFAQCLEGTDARTVVESSYREAIESGLDGAPSLFLDGTLIGGLIDYDKVAGLIRQRLQLPPKSNP